MGRGEKSDRFPAEGLLLSIASIRRGSWIKSGVPAQGLPFSGLPAFLGRKCVFNLWSFPRPYPNMHLQSPALVKCMSSCSYSSCKFAQRSGSQSVPQPRASIRWELVRNVVSWLSPRPAEPEIQGSGCNPLGLTSPQRGCCALRGFKDRLS